MTSQNAEDFTVHCPNCDGTEFYAEVELSGSAWSVAHFAVENGKVTKVDHDGDYEDPVIEVAFATGMIDCDRCNSNLDRNMLVVKKGGREQNIGPQPGKGQINLLTGDTVK
jgi:hypothetical protein